MKKGICYIVGAGENFGLDFTPKPGDYLIAADGGLSYLEKAGLAPDLVIGDFDSLPGRPAHLNTVQLSKEKDDTDTLAALREGIRLGYRVFHIYCGTGGRTDHTQANTQLLAWLSRQGMRGFLFGKEEIITAVTDGSLGFPPRGEGYFSVFSHSEKSSGVRLEGLKFPLENAVLSNVFPVGVSNAFTGAESRVTVGAGTLLVFYPREMGADIQ